ncbi:MAG TPA: hypothetical protein VEU11_06045 [Terriglobales bacterium]|nr:hypothetical protein [Terriglobales bacterium]
MEGQLNPWKAVRSICVVLAAAAIVQGAERSVYFYDAKNISEAAWHNQIRKWRSEGIRRAIVSVESGPAFLLEDAVEAPRLARFFAEAASDGIHIEALILQDPSWVLDPAGARVRLRSVIDFERRYKGSLDAVQIDVEVYTAPKLFSPNEAWGRYGALLAALRDELKQDGSRLRLNAALPWWLNTISPSELGTIIQYLDGMLLMVYTGPGETPVAVDLETFQKKVLPAIKPLENSGPILRIGIAKYEFTSQQALEAFAGQVDLLLAEVPGFAGVSYFHETANFVSAATP